MKGSCKTKEDRQAYRQSSYMNPIFSLLYTKSFQAISPLYSAKTVESINSINGDRTWSDYRSTILVSSSPAQNPRDWSVPEETWEILSQVRKRFSGKKFDSFQAF